MRAALTLAALALALGCSKGEEPGGEATSAPVPAAPQVQLIGEVEAERGRRACADYVEAVCAKAEADPSLAGDCELARSRPQALEMNLRVARAGGDLEVRDLAAVVAETRNIAAACIEDLAAIGGPIEAAGEPEE